jgi:hypothetical protein
MEIHVVQNPFFATKEDELSLMVGEVVTISRYFGDGWVEGSVVNRTDRHGIFPEQCVLNLVEAKQTSGHATRKVTHPYRALREDELTLKENDVIEVLKQEEDGWMFGRLRDRTGFFPANHTIPLTSDFTGSTGEASSSSSSFRNSRPPSSVKPPPPPPIPPKTTTTSTTSTAPPPPPPKPNTTTNKQPAPPPPIPSKSPNPYPNLREKLIAFYALHGQPEGLDIDHIIQKVNIQGIEWLQQGLQRKYGECLVFDEPKSPQQRQSIGNRPLSSKPAPPPPPPPLQQQPSQQQINNNRQPTIPPRLVPRPSDAVIANSTRNLNKPTMSDTACSNFVLSLSGEFGSCQNCGRKKGEHQAGNNNNNGNPFAPPPPLKPKPTVPINSSPPIVQAIPVSHNTTTTSSPPIPTRSVGVVTSSTGGPPPSKPPPPPPNRPQRTSTDNPFTSSSSSSTDTNKNPFAPPPSTNKTITKTISRKFHAGAEPPPPEFYERGVDTYSASVMMQSSGFASQRVETFKIKRSDRSKIIVEITQDSSSPEATLKAVIKPFQPVSQQQLLEYNRQFGPGIVSFAKSNMGKVVGNGECWTLANEAVTVSGAEPPISRNFGQKIPWREALPGDIIQFRECTFTTPNGGTVKAGLPDHTAIITGVKGDVIEVIEQNPKPVSVGSYPVGGLVKGTFDVYRPLPRDNEF